MPGDRKLYMVKTYCGRRFYARAENGSEARDLVRDYIANSPMVRNRLDYPITAVNCDNDSVVPG